MESQQKAYEVFIKTHGMNLFSRDDGTIAKRSFEAGYNAASPVSALSDLSAAATPAPLADAELATLQAAIANENEAYKSGSPTWTAYYKEACELAYNKLPGLLARLAALQAFKDYVHRRFDEANIDRHDEQNAINGCRVGKRFDDLERYMQLTDAQKTREALVAVANGLAEAIDNEDNQQAYEIWRGIADVLTSVDSSTIGSLRLIVPPTVKGGQPHA